MLAICNICGVVMRDQFDVRDKVMLECSLCGNLNFSKIGYSKLINFCSSLEQSKRMLVSHELRKIVFDKVPSNYRSRSPVYNIEDDQVEKLCCIEYEEIADIDILNNLVKYLCKICNGNNAVIKLNFSTHGSIIGATNFENFDNIIDLAVRKELIVKSRNGVAVTENGFLYFESFSGSVYWPMVGYFALQFIDEDSTQEQHEHVSFLRGAMNEVKVKTGFPIMSLESPDAVKSGLIDFAMKSAIDKSKFIVADLTYNNQGVYWEAGYALGKNKKVFYILNTEITSESRIHFNVRNFDITSWNSSSNNLVDNLCNRIRNDFPEARRNGVLL